MIERRLKDVNFIWVGVDPQELLSHRLPYVNSFEYRIDGKVYRKPTDEFKKVWESYKIMQILAEKG